MQVEGFSTQDDRNNVNIIWYTISFLSIPAFFRLSYGSVGPYAKFSDQHSIRRTSVMFGNDKTVLKLLFFFTIVFYALDKVYTF